MTIEDSNNVKLFQSENTRKDRFSIQLSSIPGTLRFYSSFSSRTGNEKGFRLRYLVIGQFQGILD